MCFTWQIATSDGALALFNGLLRFHSCWERITETLILLRTSLLVETRLDCWELFCRAHVRDGLIKDNHCFGTERGLRISSWDLRGVAMPRLPSLFKLDRWLEIAKICIEHLKVHVDVLSLLYFQADVSLEWWHRLDDLIIIIVPVCFLMVVSITTSSSSDPHWGKGKFTSMLRDVLCAYLCIVLWEGVFFLSFENFTDNAADDVHSVSAITDVFSGQLFWWLDNNLLKLVHGIDIRINFRHWWYLALEKACTASICLAKIARRRLALRWLGWEAAITSARFLRNFTFLRHCGLNRLLAVLRRFSCRHVVTKISRCK